MFSQMTEGMVQIWLTLDPADGLDEVEVDWLKFDPPGWWTHDIQETGLDWVLDLISEENCLQFLLTNGIAPGQPFLVEFTRPDYWTDYWGEHDVDYNWDLIETHPIPPDETLRSWEEFLGRGKANSVVDYLRTCRVEVLQQAIQAVRVEA